MIPSTKGPNRIKPCPPQAPPKPSFFTLTTLILLLRTRHGNLVSANGARVVKPEPRNNAIRMVHVVAWKLPRFTTNLKILLANGALRILLQVTALDLHRRDGVDDPLRRRRRPRPVVLRELLDELVQPGTEEVVPRVQATWDGTLSPRRNHGFQRVGTVEGLENDPGSGAGLDARFGFQAWFGSGSGTKSAGVAGAVVVGFEGVGVEAADGGFKHEGKCFEQTGFWGRVVVGEVNEEPWRWHVYFHDELAEAARARDFRGVIGCDTDHAAALEAPV